MAEAIVQDWLSEYESIEDDEEMRVFANMHEMNPEVVDAIYTILNERIKYPDLVHSVCNQFHSFYRSSEEKLRRFALQFIPVLIYIYLNSVAMGDKKNCRSVETLLISIYNIEVSTDDGQPKIVSFRMPVLAQASIYHEEKSTLHATDLRRWEENINRDVKWGPLPQIELINAQNRMKIMTALLFCYNQQLSLIQKAALLHLCRVASQIVNQGFAKSGHVYRTSYGSDPSNVTSPSALSPKASPRIALSSPFLIELVHSIYFAMFNDFGTIAIQTLEDIHHRACYEMFADSILVTNAVRHSLHANPSGQPNDGPMGLSVALTPATTTVVVSKSMITNASFRTKKLPDDIPIQIEQQNASGSVPLTSISEEDGGDKNQIGTRNIGIRSSKEGGVGGIKAQAQKALIAGFKKVKDKDKDKEKDKDKDKEKDKDSNVKISSSVMKNGSIDISAGGSSNVVTIVGSNTNVNVGSNIATSGAVTIVGINETTTTKVPPKVPARRDKRTSIQVNDTQDHQIKSLSSPQITAAIKHNQILNDTTTTTSSTDIIKTSKANINLTNKNTDMIPMQILSNGKTNFVVNDTKIDGSIVVNNYDSIDSNYCDASDSVISSNEVSLTMPPQIIRPSITAIINANIMDLQHHEQQQQQQQQQSLQKPRIQSEV
ncbi:hyccin isoform X1 [Condylostylus longicornis]|uniref:hyccin isoform X1 n=1 Tax=Condylostylus longicornis TaxID=2530218 RepID=UPI00244E17CA|nr:hyccin isoform X1 [Condylostylus longicornis]